MMPRYPNASDSLTGAVRRKLCTLLGGISLFAFYFCATAQAQGPVNFGSVNVGAETSATVTLQFVHGGVSAGSPAVLTQGASNLDFLNTTSGTCNTNGPGYNYAPGSTCTVAVNFKPMRPGIRLGAVEVLDSAGSTLAVTYIYGVGLGPQITYINNVLGIYEPGSQLAISGYNYTSNVAVDAEENVYGINFTLGNIYEATAASGYQTLITLGGGFVQPQSLMIDGAGNLYVADQSLNTVSEIPPGCGSSACVITLPGTYEGASGVAVDGSGNVYVAASSTNTISEIQTDGTVITIGTFNNPDLGLPDLALDAENNIFLEVTNQPTITEYFASSGYKTTQSINTAFTGTYFIGGIAVDATGNIFIPEGYSNSVFEFTAADNYSTILTLGNNLDFPNGIAVDGSGNVYISNSEANDIIRLDYTDPPALTFETTHVGSTSADSPQTVYFVNDGNEDLDIIIPTAGTNPTINSPEFSLDTGITGACPELTTASSKQGILKAGDFCLLPVSFTPLSPGNFTGQLLITDNALNAAAPDYAQQTIQLSGKGINATTITTLTSSADAIFLDNAFVLTATVSSNYGTPVGNLTIYDGTTAIGSGALDGNGSFTLNISTMTRGNHLLTASYAGTTFFLPSVSPVLTEQIVDFSFTPLQASKTVLPGQYVTYSLTVAPLLPATSMPSAIQLTQTGIPDISSYKISVVTIPAGSGSTTFTVTISAPIGFAQSNRGGIPTLALALMILPLSLRLNKRLRKRMQKLSIITFLLAALGAAMLIQGCGNVINPRTYNIQITGTAGALTHTADLTMNFK
jgi:streptogramin lyase